MRLRVIHNIWVEGFDLPFVVEDDQLGNPEFLEDGSIVFRRVFGSGLVVWKFANYKVYQEVAKYS